MPVKLTTPLFAVKMPLVSVQFPLTLILADGSGFKIPSAAMDTFAKSDAVAGENWPSVIVKLFVTFTAASGSTSTASDGLAAVLAIVKL